MWEIPSLSAGFGRGQYTAAFRSFGAFSLPLRAGAFASGAGMDYWSGAGAGLRITDALTLTGAAGLGYASAEFVSAAPVTLVNPATGQAVAATITYTLQPRYYYGQLSLGGRLSLGSGLFASLSGGAMLPFGGEFSATEIWTVPAGIAAPAPRAASGKVTNLKSIVPFAAAGFGAELPVSAGGEYLLAPALTARFGFNPLPAGSWNGLAAGAELALRYRPARVIRVLRDTITERDTITRLVRGITAERFTPLARTLVDSSVIRTPDAETHTYRVRQTYLRSAPKPAPLLTGQLGVKFVGKSGEASSVAQVNVEQTLRRAAIPLLPYLFFGPGETAIAPRYSTAGDAELPRRLFYDGDALVLPLYRTILPVAAQRLREHPAATLTVTGLALAGESTETAEHIALLRARNVRDALAGLLGGDTSRLAVRARIVSDPPRAAPAAEEYRRAELESDSAAILAPVILTDTVSTADPPVVRFYPEAISEAGVVSWKISVLQSGRLLRTIVGDGDPPAHIDWNINDGGNRERLVVAPVAYVLSLTDAEGQTSETSPQTLEFQQAVTVREIRRRREEFSLMCFNYDETNLAASSAGQLAFIRERLPAGANYSVTGTTDSLGSESYNKDLSLRRARVIARQLGAAGAAAGLGEDAATFDNSTPEGRFYSRRVRIVVDYQR